MSKKKICFIAQFPPPMDGLGKAVETLYQSDLGEEFDFEKVNIKSNRRLPQNLAAIFKSNADLFYFTISQSRGGNLRDLFILKLLEIRKKRCLIHLHGGYYRTLLEQLDGWQKAANFKAVSKLSGAIVLGPSLKWIFDGMLPAQSIYTVPNCVDDQYLMDDGSFQHKLDTLGQRSVKHVLYLSNMIRTKGYPEVLQMAKLERDAVAAGRARKLHFDFAGHFFEEAERQFFYAYLAENQLEDYVTYHGVVGGAKKKELLEQSDFFALLTTYPKEGQPISILEAMGNGMVILTTNHAGIPDVVKDGVNGLVLDPSDLPIDACFSTIRSLSDRDILEYCQENRVAVKTHYTEKRYLENMKKIFREV